MAVLIAIGFRTASPRRLRMLLCALAVSLVLPSGSFAAFDYQAIEQAATPAMAIVYTPRDDGKTLSSSGFVVTPRGHVVTTRHVLYDQQTVIVWSPGWGEPREMEVLLNYPAAHIALLGPKKDEGLDKTAFLDLATGAVEPQFGAHGRNGVALWLRAARSKPQSTLVALGSVIDPWHEAGISKPGLSCRAHRVVSLSRLPLHAAGGPCFLDDGRLAGMFSYCHRDDPISRSLIVVQHVVPTATIIDMLACACTEQLRRFHEGDVDIVAAVVARADKKLSPADKQEAFTRRYRFIEQVVAAVAASDARMAQRSGKTAARPSRRSTRRTARSRARSSKRGHAAAVLPERIQKLSRRHPDWSNKVLMAIYRKRPFRGMTRRQVDAMLGKPRSVIRNGDTVNGRPCSLCYYRPNRMLSFDGKGILRRIR